MALPRQSDAGALRRARVRLTWSSVLLALVVVLGGAAQPVAALPPVFSEPGPVAVPDRYLHQRLHWQPCWFDEDIRAEVPTAKPTRCADVRVPMDWRHPDAHRDTYVSIAYSRASKTSRGLLTTNPGGPGAGGLTVTAELGISKPRMFADYDLLGFDPRGYGDSEPVVCSTSQARLDRLPTTPDYRVRSRQTHAVEVAEAKLRGLACARTEFSQFVSTQQTVYDLDLIRALLGHDKLSYLGYSYGTWLGVWYADTFPQRVDRFVLDSNMQWTADMYAAQTADPPAFQRRRDRMLFPWIARNDRLYGLGTTSAQVKARYEKIRAKLAALHRRDRNATAPEVMDWTVLDRVYRNSDFPDAADAIVGFSYAGQEGELSAARRLRFRRIVSESLVGAPLSVLRRAGRTPRAGATTDVALDASSVVRCNDTPYPTDVQRLLRRADADAKAYPFVGYLDTVGMCAYWRFRQRPRTIDLAGVPTMLMIQAEGDPATPYEAALAAHRAVAGHTRLVSVADEGQHGLYIDGPSPCVDAVADRFLFSGVLPARDMVCGTTPLPGDRVVYPLPGAVPTPGRAATPKARRAQHHPGRLDSRRDAQRHSFG